MPFTAYAADGEVAAQAATEPAIDPATEEPEMTARAYLDISVDGRAAHRVVVGLYGGVTPRVVENFIALVASGYAGSAVYRVVPGLTVQLGDVLGNGGKSGAAARGASVAVDNYRVKHTVPGIVSMARGAGGAADSRFFVTTRPGDSMYLDGKYCAFGRVVEGMEVLYALDEVAGSGNRMAKKVLVTKCGMM